MRSFKDYTPANGSGEILKGGTSDSAGGAPDEGTESAAAELTRKIAAAYNGKNSSEMLKSILSEAEKSKRAGTLSNEEIDAFYEQFSPLLNGIQRVQLKAVVERLKKI